MSYAYLTSNFIVFILWVFLFYKYRGMRKPMLIMGGLALPLALFDLVFVPRYWKPVTLFHLPIGIEGFLYSFLMGGIAAVLYPVIVQKSFRQNLPTKYTHHWAGGLPFVTALSFFLCYFFLKINPEFDAYIALTIGITVKFVARRDQIVDALRGGFVYAIVYFMLLKIWLLLYPTALSWFQFSQMPAFFFWHIPGWEAVFGIFFGIYWSGLYEFIFNNKLESQRHLHL